LSHTQKRKAGIYSVEALKAAIRRIPGATYNGVGTVKQFSASATGHLVSLPGYRYDVAIDTETGQIAADTYEGRWGDEAMQNSLSQYYAIENAKMKAEEQGHEFEEIPLDDGSIKCVITLGDDLPALDDNPNTIGGTSAPTL